MKIDGIKLANYLIENGVVKNEGSTLDFTNRKDSGTDVYYGLGDFRFYYKSIEFRCFFDNDYFVLTSFVREEDVPMVIEGFNSLNKILEDIGIKVTQ